MPHSILWSPKYNAKCRIMYRSERSIFIKGEIHMLYYAPWRILSANWLIQNRAAHRNINIEAENDTLSVMKFSQSMAATKWQWRVNITLLARISSNAGWLIINGYKVWPLYCEGKQWSEALRNYFDWRYAERVNPPDTINIRSSWYLQTKRVASATTPLRNSMSIWCRIITSAISTVEIRRKMSMSPYQHCRHHIRLILDNISRW